MHFKSLGMSGGFFFCTYLFVFLYDAFRGSQMDIAKLRIIMLNCLINLNFPYLK